MVDFSLADLLGGAFAAAWIIGLYKQLQQDRWQVNVKDPDTGLSFTITIREENRFLENWKPSKSGYGVVLARGSKGDPDSRSYRINLEIRKNHDPSEPSFPRLGRFLYTNSSTDLLDKNGQKNKDNKQTHFELVSDFYRCLQLYASPSSPSAYIASKAETGLAPEEAVAAMFQLVEQRKVDLLIAEGCTPRRVCGAGMQVQGFQD